MFAQTEDEALWKNLDVTEDGWLDGTELNGGWVKFDTDGDNEVTKSEFLQGRSKERKETASSVAEDKLLFKKLDASGNGYLSGTELDGGNARAYDANKDKRVTLEEFLAGRAKNAGANAAPPATQPATEKTTPKTPAKKPTKPTAPKATGEKPAQPPASVISANKLIGLFYMQKYWIATRHLEKAIWYFAPDGNAYFNPAASFSPADLEAIEAKNKGPYKIANKELSVVWGDGQKSSGEIEIVPGGFNWDTGMFLQIKPFTDPKQIVGSYEGGTSMTFSGNSTITVKTLELRADGTFSWSGISTTEVDGAKAGGENDTTGKWTLSGYILTLAPNDGEAVRGIAFPFDDEETALKPDYTFFSGTMYKKNK